MGPIGMLPSSIMLACHCNFNARSLPCTCPVVWAVVEFSTVILSSLSAPCALCVRCLPCPVEIAEVSCICCLILSLVTLPSALQYTCCSPPLLICTPYALCSPPPILYTSVSHTCQGAVRGSTFRHFPVTPPCIVWPGRHPVQAWQLLPLQSCWVSCPMGCVPAWMHNCEKCSGSGYTPSTRWGIHSQRSQVLLEDLWCVCLRHLRFLWVVSSFPLQPGIQPWCLLS